MEPQQDAAHLDVLYVEDDPCNATLMQAVFALRPHLQLHVAVDGASAEAMARHLQPSLLLLDQRLPDCRGSDLLPVLRANYGWEDVPAISVTAEAYFDARSMGFLELWSKPMDLHAMLARLDQLLPRPNTDPAARGARSSGHRSAVGAR